jgi:kinetochore protein Spc25, fungi type
MVRTTYTYTQMPNAGKQIADRSTRAEEHRSTKTQIATLQSTFSTQSTLIARENAEKSEMQSQIQSLESHQQTQLQRRERLRAQIQSVEKQIGQKLAAQQEYARKEESMRNMNGPELAFWETYLGVRFDGVAEDLVKVTYSISGNGGKGEMREVGFELHVPPSGVYEVDAERTVPRLEREKVELVVRRLNETREIGGLLKRMRGLLSQELK